MSKLLDDGIAQLNDDYLDVYDVCRGDEICQVVDKEDGFVCLSCLIHDCIHCYMVEQYLKDYAEEQSEEN